MRWRATWAGMICGGAIGAMAWAQDQGQTLPLPPAAEPEGSVSSRVAPRLKPAFDVLEKRESTHHYKDPDLRPRIPPRRSAERPADQPRRE